MKTAMILAAGRGERLRPITDNIPKALCEINHIPLIEYHIVNLARAGFERLVINHAHLGGQIRGHLGNGKRWGISIYYAPEPPGGLETAGGIVNALPLLGDQSFVTVNADIFTDFDFSSLKLPRTSLAHLIIINKPSYCQQADFGLTTSGLLENTNRQYTFAGIACYHPAFFAGCKPGRYSVTPLLRQMATNEKISGELFQGMWFDIGTKERLELVNQERTPLAADSAVGAGCSGKGCC